MKRKKPLPHTSGVRTAGKRLRGTGGMHGVRLACDRALRARGISPSITDSCTWSQQLIDEVTP